MKLKAVYTGAITTPENLKILAEIVASNGDLTEAEYKANSSSATCQNDGSPCGVYDVERIIIGLNPSTEYTIKMTAEYDGIRAAASSPDQTATTGSVTSFDLQRTLPARQKTVHANPHHICYK